MIYNTQHSLCLEDSAATAEVLLKECNLDSESQQWIWIDQGMLICVASSRCLSAIQREPLKTQSCGGPKVDPAGLMWDCDKDRLISRNTSMLLSIDGRRLIFTHSSKYSKWRSLDEGDICQEKLSKSMTITGTQRLSLSLSGQFVQAGTWSRFDGYTVFHIPFIRRFPDRTEYLHAGRQCWKKYSDLLLIQKLFVCFFF